MSVHIKKLTEKVCEIFVDYANYVINSIHFCKYRKYALHHITTYVTMPYFVFLPYLKSQRLKKRGYRYIEKKFTNILNKFSMLLQSH